MTYRDLFNPDDYADEFRAFLPQVQLSNRNPLNTEMFFLWCMIRTHRPALFIESGTFRGYSATFICEALARNGDGAEFVTFGFDLDDCLRHARARLARYPFAHVVEGDSRIHLRRRAPEPRRTAFFIDGPKGRNMPPLFRLLGPRFPSCAFIAIHDCERESTSRNRRHVEQFFGPEFPIVYCDGTFQEPFQEFDAPLIGKAEVADWRPYYSKGAPRASYGTETAYVLTERRHNRCPRPLLKPYRWVRCQLLRGWI